jgi:3'5'-cyclic nucleotide phosphodiesterase
MLPARHCQRIASSSCSMHAVLPHCYCMLLLILLAADAVCSCMHTGTSLAFQCVVHTHIIQAFRVLRQDRCNFFRDVDPLIVRSIRDTMIPLVMATDLKFHFDLLGEFNSHLSDIQNEIGEERLVNNRLDGDLPSMTCHCVYVTVGAAVRKCFSVL